ncbi:golgin subfamily A member 6B-like [Piliocolobus tephrosceles]|uniref:golgin subfamily A member 6B-like n=1 Tax=Piliocolobus tephrosceles TaxID=591936 RepID=UPI000E6B39DF|nr:golgin subfamily A member 6B-like [Piliocolobus tephrosceles]
MRKYISQGAMPKCGTGKGGHQQAAPGPRDASRVCNISVGVGVEMGVNLGTGTSMAAKHPSLRVNLLELQGQVLCRVGDHNEGHDKFLAAAQSPADEPALGAPSPQELGSADKQGDLHEVSLTDSVEPAPGEAGEGSPHNNPTAQKIVQLLPLMQDSPGAPRLGQQPLHAILSRLPRTGR